MTNLTLTAERQACADAMAADLFALERSLEVSLAHGAGLVQAVAQNRAPLGLSIMHGQPLLDSAVALIAKLNTARADLIALHKLAAVTQRQVGVRTVAGDPGVKPPPVTVAPGMPTNGLADAPLEREPLRVVA